MRSPNQTVAERRKECGVLRLPTEKENDRGETEQARSITDQVHLAIGRKNRMTQRHTILQRKI